MTGSAALAQHDPLDGRDAVRLIQLTSGPAVISACHRFASSLLPFPFLQLLNKPERTPP